jgi:hypothetical protein
VYSEAVQFLINKTLNKLSKFKSSIVKTGLFISLAAYWGVILVGTFISFN